MSTLRDAIVVLPAASAFRGRTILYLVVSGSSDKLKMHVAISAPGVSYTEDGCRSWQPRNRGTRADFLPDRHPGFGQCVHKLLAAADGKRFRRLDHCGVCQSNSPRRGREIFPRSIR
jgi:hypothetical protein